MTVIEHPWSLSARSVLDHYGFKDTSRGLTAEQVVDQREKHGRNELPTSEGTSLFMLILKQFEDKLVIILLCAAVVSFFLALLEEGEDRMTAFVEPAVILIILICNATVGVVQETNAENAIERLKESEASNALVIRQGVQTPVEAIDLVPGDLIVVTDGDKVPADARIVDITSTALMVEETALTGESDAVSKSTDIVKVPSALNQDKKNMIFAGSLLVRGRCLAVVTTTGASTELGVIASGLVTNENDEEEKTPLQRKLDDFGDQLSQYISIICILVWLINIGHFTDPAHGSILKGAIYYFKIAVALAVAAIPEGLPAVVTTCLAIGTQKMAKNGAIVRSLPSVETLGCTTVICSDKTGTLTTNKMTVQRLLIASAQGRSIDLHEYGVLGDSWAPIGAVVEGDNDDTEVEYPAVDVPALSLMSKVSSLCTEASLITETNTEGELVYSKTGAPTEAALLVLAEKLGVDDQSVTDSRESAAPAQRVNIARNYWNSKYTQEVLLEFTRDRKTMSVIVADEQGNRSMLVKGAAERVLERCSHINVAGTVKTLTRDLRSEIEARLDELNAQGLRCLAMAYKENPATGDQVDYSIMDRYAEYESDLVFVGVAGMLDPPRGPVKDALAECRQAGIRVIVITGDNKLTAESICRRIGLFTEDEDLNGKSFTGAEVSQMTEEQLSSCVSVAALFSRVEPRHKLMIVEALKKQGETVAMTGDGVNDATALKRADIGIAMGSGTSVAKEASNMVLQDDNFATIVMAVQEGRAIYANTKQFIRYLISSNIGEVACIFGTAALGIPDALIPVQLLWVNLVTDGLPATALGLNPADPDIMKQKPRDQDENIINGWMFFRYLAIGLYVGLGTIGGYIWWYLYAASGPHITYWQLSHFHQCAADSVNFMGVDCSIFSHAVPSTISLSVLVTIEMFNALNAISENQSLLTVTPFSNMYVIGAVILSFVLHLIILYVPAAASIFHAAPLNKEEWIAVIVASFPVFILDEVLKFISRIYADKSVSIEKKNV